MKATARKWVVAATCMIVAGMVSNVALAADVTDQDRTYRNFTREAATLSKGQIRVEVRGMTMQDDGDTTLNSAGFRLRSIYGETFIDPTGPGTVSPNKVKRVNGGQLDLVTSYGIADSLEVGAIVPGFIENVRFAGGDNFEQRDIGDLQLYTKFKQQVAENCNVAGGVELSLPNGPERKGFGSGELGVTPFVGTRYQKGAYGVGINAGYQFFSGTPVAIDNTFHYGAQLFMRGGPTWSLRTEIAGRLFTTGGTRFNELLIMPGIDYNLTDRILLRPTGLASGTRPGYDWGLGLGVAVTL